MIICLMGRTASGKSTIESMLEADGYSRIVSYTSREVREGEKDGVNYFFRDMETMCRMYADNKFMEMNTYCGCMYATPAVDIINKNWICVVEKEGFKNIKNYAEGKGIVLGILLDVLPSTSFNRCVARPGETYESASHRIINDKEAMKDLAAIADVVINAEVDVTEVYREVVKHINRRQAMNV